MSSKKILVVDADTLVVAAAAQAQNTIMVTDPKSGKSKAFKSKDALRNVMSEKGTLHLYDKMIIESCVTPEPVQNALSNTKSKINKIIDLVNPDKTIIVVGGKSTYRQQLELPTAYKIGRAVKPVHVDACKEYLVDRKGAYYVHGIEADDEVCILSEEYKADGCDVVLASPDHDSFQMHGITLLNYKADDLSKGFIKLDSHWFDVLKIQTEKAGYNKSVGGGVGYLAGQLLFGCDTDTYKPSKVSGIKYGIMSAKNDFNGCVQPSDFLTVVREKYKEWYPVPVTYETWDGKMVTKDWLQMLQLYFKAAYMLRSRYDEADAIKFFEMNGVIL